MQIGLNYFMLTQALLIRWATPNLFASLWLGCICLSGTAVYADDLSVTEESLSVHTRSVLTSGYSVDSDGGQSLSFNANLAIGTWQHLILGLVGNDQTLAASGEQLETNTYLIGYTIDLKSNGSLGVEYEQWGDEGELITDTIRLPLGWDAQNWSFTLMPQRREILLDTERGRQFEVTSNGLALDIDYLGFDQWFLGVSYLINDYSEDLVAARHNARDFCVNRTIRIFPCLEIVASYFNRLQSVTDNNQLSLAASYYAGANTVGISWQRNESEIDASLTYATTLHLSTDLLDSWSLTLIVGQQYNVDNSTTEFIGGSLSYFW